MTRHSMLPLLLLAVGAAGCHPNPTPTPATNDTPVVAAIPAAFCQPRAAGFPPPATLADWSMGARPIDNLGTFHRGITTKSDEAQKYFDQGMRLVWGFNHDEATRAFVKAGQIDPDCASCWWGAALTLGPNYNIPMLPDRAQAAWDALTKAKGSAAKGTPVEQALIQALTQRYAGPQPLDPPAMQPHLEAYAKAMAEVAAQFPDDDDVQVMYAESLMTANPWRLWSLDGKPAPGTTEIVSRLEAVMRKNPDHPGANHYYIHAVEASPDPGRALASAERLPALMKGAGHIVHMPAHIFERVGRYADAEAANVRGAEADLVYMHQVAPQGYYGMYLAHNYDFESASAAMEGRSQVAIESERKTRDAAPASIIDNIPGMDFYVAKVYLAQIRFGRWDDVLAEKVPDDKYPIWSGLYRFAHAYALAAKGQLEAAEKEQHALDDYAGRLPPDLTAGYNSARDVLSVGSALIAARVAQGRGDLTEAVRVLRIAVAHEDTLAYDEPDDWFFPTRHLLGAALVASNQGAEAEAIYREDLRRHPNNGWALIGLSQALKAQKKDSADADRQFQAAWKNADVTLTASAF